jgi:hypothetical protein
MRRCPSARLPCDSQRRIPVPYHPTPPHPTPPHPTPRRPNPPHRIHQRSLTSSCATCATTSQPSRPPTTRWSARAATTRRCCRRSTGEGRRRRGGGGTFAPPTGPAGPVGGAARRTQAGVTHPHQLPIAAALGRLVCYPERPPPLHNFDKPEPPQPGAEASTLFPWPPTTLSIALLAATTSNAPAPRRPPTPRLLQGLPLDKQMLHSSSQAPARLRSSPPDPGAPPCPSPPLPKGFCRTCLWIRRSLTSWSPASWSPSGDATRSMAPGAEPQTTARPRCAPQPDAGSACCSALARAAAARPAPAAPPDPAVSLPLPFAMRWPGSGPCWRRRGRSTTSSGASVRAARRGPSTR